MLDSDVADNPNLPPSLSEIRVTKKMLDAGADAVADFFTFEVSDEEIALASLKAIMSAAGIVLVQTE